MKRDLSKKKTKHSGENMAVAIVHSEFNSNIVKKLLKETISELKINKTSQIETYSVPGALEIPITVKKLAKTNIFNVIIALGAVIKGETKHFEHVCRESINGIMKVSLETQIPVISGILTVTSEKQAIQRICRGKEFAQSAIHIFHTLKNI